MKKVFLIMIVFMSACSVFQTETYQEKAIRQAMIMIFERPQDFVRILNRSAFVKEGTKNFEKMPLFYVPFKHKDYIFEHRDVPFDELIKNAKKIVKIPDEKSLIGGVGYSWYFEYYIYSDEFDGGFQIITVSWHLNSYNCWSFGGISVR